MKIVLATRNRKKIEEIQRIVSGLAVTLLTLDDFPEFPEVVEDGETFQANADKKAVAIAKQTGLAALADDSGLVVDALGGAPGVHSARFAGPNASDADNLERLLKDLDGVPDEKRTARFECLLSLALGPDEVFHFSGTVEGRIGHTRRGENGFGYDPVFFPLEAPEHTFAEMTAAQKDGMSHRGRALIGFAKALEEASSNSPLKIVLHP
ncbi:MAG: XTP/dITP diphosphatase [Magnetococcales bacterium]|nr:XTP/dITP diphosphatase [Magnetococcales bacterium]